MLIVNIVTANGYFSFHWWCTMIRHATIYNQTSTCSNSTMETLENGVKYDC